MSIRFFKSDAVKAYPCSYRGNDGVSQINPKARMITEEGLVGLGGVGGLKSSYAISFDSDLLDCVIAGYRFKIDCSEYAGDLADLCLCALIGEDTSTDSDASGKEKLARLQCLKNGQDVLDGFDGDAYRFYGVCLCSEAEAKSGWTILKAFDSKGELSPKALLPKLSENGSTTGVGEGNAANGEFSLAFGENAVANGSYSAAIGLNVSTKDGIDGQVVVGKFGAESDAQFAVANGDESEKKNSFETGGGTTNINEKLIALREAEFKDCLKVSKSLSLGESEGAFSTVLDENGNATFGGALSANAATVNGNATFGGALSANEATVKGKASLAGIADFKEDEIKLSATKTTVSNQLSANSIIVDDSAEAKTLSVTQSCSIGTTTTISGTLTADQTTELVKKDDGSYSAKITKDKIELNAEIDASKEDLKAKSIEVTKSAKLPGADFADGKISIQAPAEVSDGNSIKTPRIEVDAIAARTESGEIKVESSVSVDGKLTATGLAIGKADIDESTVEKLNAIENRLETKQATVTEEALISKLTVSGEGDGAVTIGNSAYATTTSGNTLLKVYGKVEANRYNARSDARLKENLREYEPKKSILELPVYEYDYKSGDKDVIGCLAQDLQEICPEIVSEGKDGYLSVEESKIVYLLLKEVKKLREEVEELKRR